MWQVFFFFLSFFYCNYLATLTTNWVQIFTGLLLYAYVEIHQLRRLVFDNCQQCPVSLTYFAAIYFLKTLKLKWRNNTPLPLNHVRNGSLGLSPIIISPPTCSTLRPDKILTSEYSIQTMTLRQKRYKKISMCVLMVAHISDCIPIIDPLVP